MTGPATDLLRLHGDPQRPVPAMSDHRLLRELPDDVIDALLSLAEVLAGADAVDADRGGMLFVSDRLRLVLDSAQPVLPLPVSLSRHVNA